MDNRFLRGKLLQELVFRLNRLLPRNDIYPLGAKILGKKQIDSIWSKFPWVIEYFPDIQ